LLSILSWISTRTRWVRLFRQPNPSCSCWYPTENTQQSYISCSCRYCTENGEKHYPSCSCW
jgi:hypothetical protein